MPSLENMVYIYILYINIGTIAFSDNKFEDNYAYFSGGAIYMNLPFQAAVPKGILYIYIYIIYIVPIYLFSNKLLKNNCWKRSSGGGMSIRGRIITSSSTNSEDENFMLTGVDPTYYGSPIVQTYLDTLTSDLNDQKGGIVIKDGTFNENIAGYRGTACFIQDIPRTYIVSTTFTNNAPVLWGRKELNTYYTQYIKPIIDQGGNPQYFCATDSRTQFNDQEFMSLYNQDPTSAYIS